MGAVGAVPGRRIPDKHALDWEVEAWEGERNEARATVERRFANEDVMTKSHKLHPTTP